MSTSQSAVTLCGWWLNEGRLSPYVWSLVNTCQRFRDEYKGKGFPYSIPSVGPGADPTASRWTSSHPPSGRLPLLFSGPAVIFPAAEHHRLLAGTKIYCLVTEAHRREQLVQGCYAALPEQDLNPRPIDRKSNALPVAPPQRVEQRWI